MDEFLRYGGQGWRSQIPGGPSSSPFRGSQEESAARPIPTSAPPSPAYGLPLQFSPSQETQTPRSSTGNTRSPLTFGTQRMTIPLLPLSPMPREENISDDDEEWSLPILDMDFGGLTANYEQSATSSNSVAAKVATEASKRPVSTLERAMHMDVDVEGDDVEVDIETVSESRFGEGSAILNQATKVVNAEEYKASSSAVIGGTPDRARATASSSQSQQKSAVARTSATPDVFETPNRYTQQRTGVFYEKRLLDHRMEHEDSEVTYCEVPGRLTAAVQELKRRGLWERLMRIRAQPAHMKDLILAHSEEHVREIESTRSMSEEELQRMSTRRYTDVYFAEATADCAALSSAGARAAAESVWQGVCQNSIALIRPPGHHAEATEAMGFCIYNNVAIAAKVLQQRHGAKRILILDWDVHHGNGTQRMFYRDPNVLFISIHRYENAKFFPGQPNAGADYTGGKEAPGRNVNIPWSCDGIDDADYLYAFQHIVMPIAREFSPEIVLISAGFDAAKGDPLGMCQVSPAGFAQMTHMLKSVAGGKLVVCLEGGYNLEATAVSIAAVTEVLLGKAPGPVDVSCGPSTACLEVTDMVLRYQRPFWKNLGRVYLGSEINATSLDSRSTPMADILSVYRSTLLTTEHSLSRIFIQDESIHERFFGSIHVSKDLITRTGCVYMFVHPTWDDVRSRMLPASNLLDLQNTSVHDVSSRYISDIIRSGHAVMDIELDSSRIPKKDVAHVAREVVKYAWDTLCEKKLVAEHVVVIGVDIGAKALTNLLSVRPRLRQLCAGAAMMLVQTPTTRFDDACVFAPIADWYSTHSRVYAWCTNIPKDKHIKNASRLGACFSAGPPPSWGGSVSTLMEELRDYIFLYTESALRDAARSQTQQDERFGALEEDEGGFVDGEMQAQAQQASREARAAARRKMFEYGSLSADRTFATRSRESPIRKRGTATRGRRQTPTAPRNKNPFQPQSSQSKRRKVSEIQYVDSLSELSDHTSESSSDVPLIPSPRKNVTPNHQPETLATIMRDRLANAAKLEDTFRKHKEPVFSSARYFRGDAPGSSSKKKPTKRSASTSGRRKPGNSVVEIEIPITTASKIDSFPDHLRKLTVRHKSDIVPTTGDGRTHDKSQHSLYRTSSAPPPRRLLSSSRPHETTTRPSLKQPATSFPATDSDDAFEEISSGSTSPDHVQSENPLFSYRLERPIPTPKNSSQHKTKDDVMQSTRHPSGNTLPPSPQMIESRSSSSDDQSFPPHSKVRRPISALAFKDTGSPFVVDDRSTQPRMPNESLRRDF
ncbi:hypothetical protein DFS34DRAFT_691050 [Phlyctochytrium arcticum]|nr:hypothetical protein DFS34DRAFT_691050 [Phlyctochytrium arcticum]